MMRALKRDGWETKTKERRREKEGSEIGIAIDGEGLRFALSSSSALPYFSISAESGNHGRQPPSSIGFA